MCVSNQIYNICKREKLYNNVKFALTFFVCCVEQRTVCSGYRDAFSSRRSGQTLASVAGFPLGPVDLAADMTFFSVPFLGRGQTST